MTFSKTTKYALAILALMAEKQDELFSSDFIHRRLKIPKKYLQRLLTDLTKYELIISVRGKYGGFKLGRSSKKIYLSEIIDSIEGFKREPICFFGFEKCLLSSPCAMHDVWANLQLELVKTLSTTRLYDLVSNKKY